MNGLLHLRIAIAQFIEGHVERLKAIVLAQEEAWKGPHRDKIKDYIYKISHYDKNEGKVEFDLEKDLKEEECRVGD